MSSHNDSLAPASQPKSNFKTLHLTITPMVVSPPPIDTESYSFYHIESIILASLFTLFAVSLVIVLSLYGTLWLTIISGGTCAGILWRLWGLYSIGRSFSKLRARTTIEDEEMGLLERDEDEGEGEDEGNWFEGDEWDSSQEDSEEIDLAGSE